MCSQRVPSIATYRCRTPDPLDSFALGGCSLDQSASTADAPARSLLCRSWLAVRAGARHKTLAHWQVDYQNGAKSLLCCTQAPICTFQKKHNGDF